MSALDLLPCPFCGGPAMPIHDEGTRNAPPSTGAECANENCIGNNLGASVSAWNQRKGKASSSKPAPTQGAILAGLWALQDAAARDYALGGESSAHYRAAGARAAIADCAAALGLTPEFTAARAKGGKA